MRIDIRDFNPANDKDTGALLAVAWVLRHERHAGADDVGFDNYTQAPIDEPIAYSVTPKASDDFTTGSAQAAIGYGEPPLTEHDLAINKAYREIAEEKSKTSKHAKRPDETDKESTNTRARVEKIHQRAAELEDDTGTKEKLCPGPDEEQDMPGLKPPIKITRGGHRPKRATPNEQPDKCGDCAIAECNAFGWYCPKTNRELAVKGRKCKHYESSSIRDKQNVVMHSVAESAANKVVKNVESQTKELNAEDIEIKLGEHVMPGVPAEEINHRDDRELEDLIDDTAKTNSAPKRLGSPSWVLTSEANQTQQANKGKPLPAPVDELIEDDDPLGLGLPAEPVDYDELRKQIFNVASALVNAGQGGAVTKLARIDPETGTTRLQANGEPVRAIKQLAENQLVRFMRDLKEI